MLTSEKVKNASPDALNALRQRVNVMLDIPRPDESEVWSLRLDNSPANIPPGHPASGRTAFSESPV